MLIDKKRYYDFKEKEIDLSMTIEMYREVLKYRDNL